ncbi:6890_t:CDS:2 [Paraglomus occultum]|uniref:6890_t:CDS:1 n=1 Tax=Paraglomus occultum TaxID=144539 RepID=A0A9N9FHY0_9GLOM|nr:6890_t:CDS:2 [Paraglomus occultum]
MQKHQSASISDTSNHAETCNENEKPGKASVTPRNRHTINDPNLTPYNPPRPVAPFAPRSRFVEDDFPTSDEEIEALLESGELQAYLYYQDGSPTPYHPLNIIQAKKAKSKKRDRRPPNGDREHGASKNKSTFNFVFDPGCLNDTTGLWSVGEKNGIKNGLEKSEKGHVGEIDTKKNECKSTN